ncbi:hypothetical protein K466DRAFT_471124, partial [Polyporus arcularius HHB13444]
EVEAEADEDVCKLLKLVDKMAEEDTATIADHRKEEGPDAPFEDDQEWADKVESLTEEERAEFLDKVVPVKLVLAKIRKLSFKIVNSPTKLLPAWNTLCREVKLPERLVPRDVPTRWNLTYNLAVATVEYKNVYKRIT